VSVFAAVEKKNESKAKYSKCISKQQQQDHHQKKQSKHQSRHHHRVVHSLLL